MKVNSKEKRSSVSSNKIVLWNAWKSESDSLSIHYFEPHKYFYYKHCNEKYRNSFRNSIFSNSNQDNNILYKYESLFNLDGTRSLYLDENGLWYKAHCMTQNGIIMKYSAKVYDPKGKTIDKIIINNSAILSVYFSENIENDHVGQLVNNKITPVALTFKNNDLVISDFDGNIYWSFDHRKTESEYIQSLNLPENNGHSESTINDLSDTVNYKLYNSNFDKCIYAPKTNKLTLGDCKDNDYNIWIMPSDRKGFFRSKSNPNLCIKIDSTSPDTIIYGKCDEKYSILYHYDNGLIKTPSSNKKCLDVEDLDGSNYKFMLNTCDYNAYSQRWWVHDVSTTTTTTTITKTKTKTTTTKTKTTTTTTSPSPTNVKTVKVYLRSKYNYGCLYAHKTEGYKLRYSSNCDKTNSSHLWEIPETGNGIWRNVGTNYYLRFTGNNNLITTKDKSLAVNMGDIKKSSTGNFIWCNDSTNCKNICFSESNGLLITQQCNKYDVNQYWKAESSITTKTKTVYIYNKYFNQCLHDKGNQTWRPVLTNCSDIKQNKWIVPVNGEGFYRSAYNSTLYLYTKDINKGTILVDICNYNSLIQDFSIPNDNEYRIIKSYLSNAKCLGFKNDGNKVNLNDCNTNIVDQQWKITPNLPSTGRYGKEFGNQKCANGECCSNYGWCGTSTDHCAKKN